MEYDPTVVPDDDDHNPEDYKVTMEYSVDGKSYTTEIHAHQSDYSIGENVEIKYDPDAPENTAVGNLSLPVVIGISAVVLIVGGIIVVVGRRF